MASIIGITQSDNDASTQTPAKKLSEQNYQQIIEMIANDKTLEVNLLRWSGATKIEDILDSKAEEAIQRIKSYKQRFAATLQTSNQLN